MGNMTAWNGGVPSKSTLGSYVRDAKELEFSLYTLELSRQLLIERIAKEKQIDVVKRIAVPRYEAEKVAVKKQLPYREESDAGRQKAVEKYREDHREEYKEVDGCIVFLNPILYAVLNIRRKKRIKASDTRAILQYRKKIQQDNEKIKKQNEQEVIRYAEECKKNAEENPKIRERNAERKRIYQDECAKAKESHKRKIAIMQEQLDDLDQAIARMTRQREQFYGANLIPVDYRTLDCVFMLDQIFRNDLADTMREAIAKYEERVYRGEVIQGISAIVSRLDNLTGLMSDLGRQLGSIQTQVSFMSNDLYDMAERQSKAQSQIMEETRLRRYATEELNRNAERIVKYCDTGRTY